MLEDIIDIQVKDNISNNVATVKLFLYDESDQDVEKVQIIYDNDKVYIADNYFDALCLIRKDLEVNLKQILCNGATKEVYPSPMQLNMGCCRKGYVQHIANQAQNENIVDIFEFDISLTPCDIKTQIEYHKQWLLSLKNKIDR